MEVRYLVLDSSGLWQRFYSRYLSLELPSFFSSRTLIDVLLSLLEEMLANLVIHYDSDLKVYLSYVEMGVRLDRVAGLIEYQDNAQVAARVHELYREVALYFWFMLQEVLAHEVADELIIHRVTPTYLALGACRV